MGSDVDTVPHGRPARLSAFPSGSRVAQQLDPCLCSAGLLLASVAFEPHFRATQFLEVIVSQKHLDHPCPFIFGKRVVLISHSHPELQESVL